MKNTATLISTQLEPISLLNQIEYIELKKRSQGLKPHDQEMLKHYQDVLIEMKALQKKASDEPAVTLSLKI